MPKRSYALFSQPDEKNLEISWDGGVFHVQGNITVRFERTLLAVFQDRNDLRIPKKVNIPGHPPISIFLQGSALRVYQQGKSITGYKDQSPSARLKDFYELAFVFSLPLLIVSMLPIFLLLFPTIYISFPFHPYTILPAILFALVSLIASKTGNIASLWRLGLVAFSFTASTVLLSIVYPLSNDQSITFGSIFLIFGSLSESGKALAAFRELFPKQKGPDQKIPFA